MACMAILILIILMVLASIKWHGIVDYLLHAEFAYYAIATFIPSD